MIGGRKERAAFRTVYENWWDCGDTAAHGKEAKSQPFGIFKDQGGTQGQKGEPDGQTGFSANLFKFRVKGEGSGLRHRKLKKGQGEKQALTETKREGLWV